MTLKSAAWTGCFSRGLGDEGRCCRGIQNRADCEVEFWFIELDTVDGCCSGLFVEEDSAQKT